MDRTRVGEKIAALRKGNGMTQKQLADQLHVTDKAVSKWERGLNFPDLTIMEPLATALGISVIELLGLGESSAEEVVREVSQISQEEKARIKRGVQSRGWVTVAVGMLLIASQIAASWEFHKLGFSGSIYGVTTIGMTGFTGSIIGSALYSIVHVRKL